jgi:TolA-binding protein
MPALSSVLLALSLFATPTLPDDADEQYQFVVGLCEKGMHDVAAKEAQSFLDRFPNHPKADLARYRLASSLFELGKTEEAAPEFRKLAARSGFEYEAEVWLRLGQCELAAKRFDPAAAAFEKSLAKNKDYLKAPASFLLAEAKFRGEKFDEAETRYQEALRLDAKGPYAKDAAYGLAWCAFRRGDSDRTIERIEDFCKRFPGDALEPELRVLEGEAHLDAGRPKEALAVYRLVTAEPFEDAALRGQGFACAALGDHANAARAFGDLVERFPKSRFLAEATLQRGIHLLEAGDAAGARQALSSPAAGAGADVLYWRARAEAKAGDREAALASLDAAERAKPADDLLGRIRVARGDLLFDLGRAGDAAKAYEQSGSDYALHAAAVASLNDGRADDAIRLAQRLLSDCPKSTYRGAASLVLGEAYFSKKDWPRAEKAFADAAAPPAEPTQRARAASRLAWCRYLADDFPEAAKRFAAVDREFPDAAEAEEAVFMEGRAQEAGGKPDEAVAAWRRHVAKFPKGEHRAEALLGLSRLEKGDAAAASLDTLLRENPQSALADRALYGLAEKLSAAGKTAEAEPKYREILQRYPQSELVPAARYGLAWCVYDEKRYAEAIDILKPLVASGMGPLRPDLRASAAELLVFANEKVGDVDAAAAAYGQFAPLVEDDARRLAAAKSVASSLKKANRATEALAILDELRKSAHDRETAAAAQVECVYLALDAKNVDDAEARARAALRDAPKSGAVAEALFFAGEARYDAGDDEKACALYSAAASVDGSSVADRALYKRGFACLRRKDNEGAAESFKKLVDGFPKSELHGEGLFLLGESLFRLDRFDAAADALSTLRRESPSHEAMPKALFRLGISLCRLERWKEAESALSDLAVRYPKFENGAEAELWRGRALAAQSQARSAREAFDRVVARDKGVLAARARIEIGKLAMSAGRTDEALSEFLKVAVLYAHDDEVAEGLYRAGQCLEKLGDDARAQAQYEEVVAKHATSSFAEQARKRLENKGKKSF